LNGTNKSKQLDSCTPKQTADNKAVFYCLKNSKVTIKVTTFFNAIDASLVNRGVMKLNQLITSQFDAVLVLKIGLDTNQ
jgi:hypothetical protein